MPPHSLLIGKLLPRRNCGKAALFVARTLPKFQNDARTAIRTKRIKTHFQEQIEAKIQGFVRFALSETLLFKVFSKDVPMSNGPAR